jgi:flavin reductase ActVB
MAVDADLYRASIARVPFPVAVVTAWTAEGDLVGFTASSVCSLSLAPPSLLISVDHTTRACDVLRKSEEFTVDFLATEHREVARLFATRGADKFSSPHLGTDEHGRPRITNAIVHMLCRVEHRIDSYDHLVITATVTAISDAQGDPLLIADRTFTAPSADHQWPFDRVARQT